jgi:hypothetical protein
MSGNSRPSHMEKSVQSGSVSAALIARFETSLATGIYLAMTLHVYEVRPRKDHRGVDLNFQCSAFRSAVVRRAMLTLTRKKPQPFVLIWRADFNVAPNKIETFPVNLVRQQMLDL